MGIFRPVLICSSVHPHMTVSVITFTNQENMITLSPPRNSRAGEGDGNGGWIKKGGHVSSLESSQKAVGCMRRRPSRAGFVWGLRGQGGLGLCGLVEWDCRYIMLAGGSEPERIKRKRGWRGLPSYKDVASFIASPYVPSRKRGGAYWVIMITVIFIYVLLYTTDVTRWYQTSIVFNNNYMCGHTPL